jgi:small GTP-binding protein
MSVTPPIQRKICMLGAFAVGKTSLVSRYVQGIFSHRYLTTIGVKVDRKLIEIGNRQVNLILWDLNGEDEFLKVRMSYVRGAAGYLLVADGTRPETLATAAILERRAARAVGSIPFVLVLNKIDLTEQWEMDETQIEKCLPSRCALVRTSARTGEGVEEAFMKLAQEILKE